MTREILILFARPPLPGRAKTRLIPALGAEGAARLYRAFLADAAEAAAAVRAARPTVALAAEWALDGGERLEALPLAEWLPGPFLHRRQTGSDLGARMAAALGRSLAGGGRAVLVGTDFPDLPPAIPLEAFEALARKSLQEPGLPSPPRRAAVGPAADGGYYLIGLNQPALEIFEDIPWGSNRVFGSTLSKLQALSFDFKILREWDDVDDPAGLAGLRARLARAPAATAPHTRAALREPHGSPEASIGLRRRSSQ